MSDRTKRFQWGPGQITITRTTTKGGPGSGNFGHGGRPGAVGGSGAGGGLAGYDPSAVRDGAYHVYHGTSSAFAEKIASEGLKPSSRYFTVSTSHATANGYAHEMEGPKVVHFAVPLDKVGEFLKPKEYEDPDPLNPESRSHILAQTLPPSMIVETHDAGPDNRGELRAQTERYLKGLSTEQRSVRYQSYLRETGQTSDQAIRMARRKSVGDTEQKGDVGGHVFHGNRFTGGIGGDEAHDVYASETAARSRLGPGAKFSNVDVASDYAGKVYDTYAPAGAYRSSPTSYGSPIEVRFEGDPDQSGVARVAEGAAVYPVITLGENMRDQLTVIHEVAHIIANEREQGLGAWKQNHGSGFRDTFHEILQGEMLAHSQMIKDADGIETKAEAVLNLLQAAAHAREIEQAIQAAKRIGALLEQKTAPKRRPGQKGEGEGHTFRGNRWTGGIGGGGRQTTTPRLKKGDKVGPYKGRAKDGLTWEKMTPGQREAVHHIVQNLPKAVGWGIGAAEWANRPIGGPEPKSRPLNPELRNSVIGAKTSLEAAGIDHEQLVRALALDAAMTRMGHAGSGGATAYTVQQYSQDMQSLEHSQSPDFKPAELVPSKIELGRAEAIAEEVMRPVRLARYVAMIKDSQGAHLAAGFTDPSKFPSFARESLTAVAQLAQRDQMLFPTEGLPVGNPSEGATRFSGGKSRDEVWNEHSAALQAVGRAVYAEIDKSGIGKEIEEAATRVARATERNTAAYQALSAARTAYYNLPENKNVRADSLIARDNAREEYYQQNRNMGNVGTRYGLGQASKEEYEAAKVQRDFAYANFQALSSAMDRIWNGDENDPAVMRAKDEFEAAKKDSTDAYAAQRLSQLAYGIEAVRVLGQIREMGGRTKLDISKSTNSNATKSFQKSAFYYPKDWFDRAFGRTKMQIGVSNVRAFCRGSLVKTGSGNDEEADSTAVHEMGHFLENYGGRAIEAAEKQFFDQRTGDDKPEPLKVAWAREYNTKPSAYKGSGQNDSNSPVYVDKFASYYMGKTYGGRTDKSNYELLTIGMENLRNPSKDYPKTDVEYKSWILGMLATL